MMMNNIATNNSRGFKWVTADCLDGHDDIVMQFKHNTNVENLPENFVIRSDEYYVDYDTGDRDDSEISEHMPYVPRRGTLTEAVKLGRDEPDIFYKLLAKKDYGGSYGSTYSTPCDLLFVRTKHKQIYKTRHVLKLAVEAVHYDQFQSLSKSKGDDYDKFVRRLVTFKSNNPMSKSQFVFEGTKRIPKRIGAAAYDARKRREKALKQATPKWVDIKAIKAIEAERDYLNRLDGRNTWAVDHIVPLQNDIVSGLNVPWNLEIILTRKNSKKSNKFVSRFQPLYENWLYFRDNHLHEYKTN